MEAGLSGRKALLASMQGVEATLTQVKIETYSRGTDSWAAAQGSGIVFRGQKSVSQAHAWRGGNSRTRIPHGAGNMGNHASDEKI